MDSRDVLPHRLGGKCVWDMRCLLPCLDMEKLDEATRRTWTKDNFWRARSYWEKLFTRAGGGQWDLIGFGLRILSPEAPSRQYMSRLVCCDMSP